MANFNVRLLGAFGRRIKLGIIILLGVGARVLGEMRRLDGRLSE